MKKPFVTFLFAALFGVMAQSARSAVVVSNLDPNNPAFGLNSPEIGQSILNGGRTLSLTSVQFDQTAGLAAGETVSIFSRNADGTLGTSLFSGFTVGFDATSTVTTATPTTAFILQPNTGYYFVLSTNSSTNLEWTYTSSTDYAAAFGATIPAADSSVFFTGATAVYRSLAAGPQMFQVNAAAVPEPSADVFLGFALAIGAGVLARRRAIAA